MNNENFKINERRQQVASLLSKSFNEKEIAHQLGISHGISNGKQRHQNIEGYVTEICLRLSKE